MRTLILMGSTLAVLGGCSNNNECKLNAACDNGQFCEAYTDGSGTHNLCFAPTQIKGKITDAVSGAPVEGARVVGIDGDSHAAVTAVSITDALGDYTLRIVSPRQMGVKKDFTLRVSAAGYQEFPSGIRIALPISVSYMDPKGMATIDGPRDVALTPLSPAPPGAIAGQVTSSQKGGVLVVAEGATGAYASVTDGDGNYVLFNVADGTYTVSGYFVGVNFAPVLNVQVAGARKDGVNLTESGPAAGVLTGVLSYVAGADTSITTAVVLRLRSVREVPPGLSTPATNSTPYRLEKIPDGTYDVLASFPTDQLVKDPDPGQAGTGTPTATFAGGNTVDVGSFKITDPVNIQGPDANAMAAGNPTFTWIAYPQTDHYLVEVFDSQGNQIWMLDNIPRSTSLVYAGPALTPKSYYQWRITSFAQAMPGVFRPISRSEDLRGVWLEAN